VTGFCDGVKEGHPIDKHDYSRMGYYFITTCTKDMRCVFGKITGTTNNQPSIVGVINNRPPYLDTYPNRS